MEKTIKKKNKLLVMFLLVLICFSNISTIVLAATEISSAKLLLGEDCGYHIQFKYPGGWSSISGNIIYYKVDGKTYPAYCISSGGTPGVDEKGSYTVNIAEVLDDVRVWRVIINGYPYKTPAQLGVEKKTDAYFATKQAIYSILFDRDVTKVYRGSDARGKKMVTAMEKLVDIGRNGTQVPQDSNLTATAVNGLIEDGENYFQEFKVTSTVDISSYEILNTNNLPENSYIANMDGEEQTEFAGGENFKLVIPKESINTDIDDVKISLQGKCKTYPVFYGETTVDGWQDYAVTYDPYGDDTAIATLSAATNTGTLKVIKTDVDTGEAIEGVTFQLKKTDGTIVGTQTTSLEGIAEFTSLYQDSYILVEESTNENYVLDTNEYEVEVKYNKITTKEITNEHKKGNISISKVDADDNSIVLEGVVFDLYSKDTNELIGTYTTDENGKIDINDVRTGSYIVKEKSSANTWYSLSADTELEVLWNKDTLKTITNELKKSQIQVEKVDEDDNNLKLAGVSFEVLDENMNLLEIITTDKNGIAVTSKYPLRDFSNLIIREKSTLGNYVLTTEQKKVALEENKTNEVVFTNELKKGKIKVVKVDADNNEVKLEGVVFEVKDTTTGEVVATLKTDSNGEAITRKYSK